MDYIVYAAAGAGLVVKVVYETAKFCLVKFLKGTVEVVRIAFKGIGYTLYPVGEILFKGIVYAVYYTYKTIDFLIVRPMVKLGRAGALLWTNFIKPAVVSFGQKVGVKMQNIKHGMRKSWRNVTISYAESYNRCLVDRGYVAKVVPKSYEQELKDRFEQEYEKHLKNLPAPESEGESVNECGVCTEPFGLSDASSFFCGHVYCQKCISSVDKCPTCRLTGKTIKLFL